MRAVVLLCWIALLGCGPSAPPDGPASGGADIDGASGSASSMQPEPASAQHASKGGGDPSREFDELVAAYADLRRRADGKMAYPLAWDDEQRIRWRGWAEEIAALDARRDQLAARGLEGQERLRQLNLVRSKAVAACSIPALPGGLVAAGRIRDDIAGWRRRIRALGPSPQERGLRNLLDEAARLRRRVHVRPDPDARVREKLRECRSMLAEALPYLLKYADARGIPYEQPW